MVDANKITNFGYLVGRCTLINFFSLVLQQEMDNNKWKQQEPLYFYFSFQSSTVCMNNKSDSIIKIVIDAIANSPDAHTKLKINIFAMEMTTFNAETWKIGEENKFFMVVTMLHSLYVEHIDVKRTLVRQLCSVDALRPDKLIRLFSTVPSNSTRYHCNNMQCHVWQTTTRGVTMTVQ